jgi:hypothetical protein
MGAEADRAIVDGRAARGLPLFVRVLRPKPGVGVVFCRYLQQFIEVGLIIGVR